MSMLNEQSSNGSMLNGSPKAMFFMGLFLGIAVSAVVALGTVLFFFVSGTTQVIRDSGAPSQQIVAAPNPTPETGEPAPAGPVKSVDEKTDHIRGKKDAKVSLIEYSDFQCPFCLRHNASIEQALKDFPNDVRVIYRHFPLSFHPEAQKAAEATECAGKQGKFWEMHDEVFKANAANQMSVAKWKEVAKTLKLDSGKFDKCLDSGETAARIAQDEQEGAVAGVTGTPGTFVNGQLVSGAVPYDQLKQIIQSKL